MDNIEFRKHSLGKDCIYIGPEPTDYFSSFTNSINEELSLHDKYGRLNGISDVLKEIGFAKIKEINPFMLSGGQAVMLAILSGLLCASDELLLDVCTEQLSETNKRRLFDLMNSDTFKNLCVSINDNRFDEIEPQNKIKFACDSNSANAHINADIDLSFTQSFDDTYTVSDLSFSYSKKVNVLENINYIFSPGKVYLLNGENGSGKSTFCKLIMGLLKPDSGTFLKNGKEIKPYRYPGRYASYTFQSPREQLFSDTITDELATRSGIPYNLDLLAQTFGLSTILTDSPFNQEYEVKKRIVLAAAFIPKPLIILDEPTLGQNENDVNELCKIIRKYNKNGISFILTSHSQKFKAIFDEAIKLEIKDRKLKEL